VQRSISARSPLHFLRSTSCLLLLASLPVAFGLFGRKHVQRPAQSRLSSNRRVVPSLAFEPSTDPGARILTAGETQVFCDVLDPVPALKLYLKRMGWDAERPPPRTPLFPRLSDAGRVAGQFYTAKDIIARMRQHMEDADVPEAGSYSLSGFQPGGHTDMLVATDGDHSVSDGIARWDTAAAERRYDRRDADAWLAKMARAQRPGDRIGVDAAERAR
jgi:hypothetical protein